MDQIQCFLFLIWGRKTLLCGQPLNLRGVALHGRSHHQPYSTFRIAVLGSGVDTFAASFLESTGGYLNPWILEQINLNTHGNPGLLLKCAHPKQRRKTYLLLSANYYPSPTHYDSWLFSLACVTRVHHTGLSKNGVITLDPKTGSFPYGH